MNIFLIILIGLSLSMDTFSLSLCLGSFNIPIKKGLFFASFVGLFHFVLPLLGSVIGVLIKNFLFVSSNKLMFVIFLVLALEMICQTFSKEEKNYAFSVVNLVLLSLSVSIDSLTIGFGLSGFVENQLISSFIFFTFSFCFTALGLFIGKYSYKKIGKWAYIMGILIILCLSFYYLIK